MTLTTHMLREQLEGVTKQVTQNGIITNNNSNSSTMTVLDIQEMVIEKVYLDAELISDENITVQLLNPLPCLYWKCVAKQGEDGYAHLSTPIRILTLRFGENYYCLGILDKSNEFELRCTINNNEIRVNPNFMSIMGAPLIINGVEKK